MEQVSLINCYDPRGNMPCSVAKLNDPLTLVAIERISKCLEPLREYAVSAAQIGINVNVLGVRLNDTTKIVLNPTLCSQGKPELQLGFVHPQCPLVRRDIWRFSKLTVVGSNIGGNTFDFEVNGKLAHNVQTALEYANQPRSFDWLTSFHHFLGYHPQEGVRVMCRAVVDGLYKERPAPQARDEIMRIGLDRFSWRLSSGAWHGEIDGLNPMRPTTALDQLLQSLVLGLSGRNSLLVFGAETFGLTLALALAAPNMKIHVGSQDWPMAAASDLGLVPRFAQQPVLWGREGNSETLPKVDALILDGRAPDVSDKITHQSLRKFAKSLNGMDGLFLLLQNHRDAELETALKSSFLNVYRFEIPGGPVVYACRKYELPLNMFWDGFSNAMSTTGLDHLNIVYSCGGVLLRKDGIEVPL